MKYFWGADPGKTGALSIVDQEGVGLTTMDFTVDLSAFCRDVGLLKREYRPTLCALEKAQAMPKQGVVGVFNYGTNYGHWQMTLTALRVPYVLVTPQMWKKAMLVGVGKADKDAIRLSAIRQFPDLAEELKRKKDHNRAEAFYLAMWARRFHYEGK